MPTPTWNPSDDLDIFCHSVEGYYGYDHPVGALLTEFVERQYTYLKLRGMLGATEIRRMYAEMASNPSRFLSTTDIRR